MTLVARGWEGQMFFDGDQIVIKRRGLIPFITHGSGGTKTIPLRSVTAIQHRRCGIFHGYLQLSVSGELERHGSGRGGVGSGGTMSKDENAIVFYFVANPAFQILADALRKAMSDLAAGRPVTVPNATQAVSQPIPTIPAVAKAIGPQSARTIFQQVEELAQMRDVGYITADEFALKKIELLSRL